jgi:hypothetical protein
MAFTKAPENNTYQTKLVSLLKEQNDRGINATKDVDYQNVFFEIINNKEAQDQRYFIQKRSGCTEYVAAVAGTTIRGMHYNEDFRKLYYVIGSTLYVWNVTSGALTTSIPAFFGTSSGDVAFCDYLYDTGTAVVVITDGTTLKMISSTQVVTTCADADLPAHIPSLAFLDGYIFLIKNGTSDIYNSDLNDPMSWTPGNFITAEIAPDDARKIVKLNNYLVVFGSGSIEYFWDAGVASGSPLQRNDTPVKLNGYIGGLAQWGNNIFFVGNNKEGQPDVFMLEDFKMDTIGDTTITRYLQGLATTYSTWKGSIVGIDGHHFYVLNAGESTYVYDIGTKLWGRWAFQQTDAFKMLFCVNTKVAADYRSIFAIAGTTALYSFDSTVYKDNDVNFTCHGITASEEFDTMNRKQMYRLTVWADRPTFDSQMSIYYTDDDYQTFVGPRNVQLNSDLPAIHQLGTFRKRAFKWSYTSASPMRIRAFEVDINKGQT